MENESLSISMTLPLPLLQGVFTKLVKIPISVIGKLNMELINFLDYISIMASTKKEFQERSL